MSKCPQCFRDRPIFDPLTQVVRLLKPSALLLKQLETRGPWAVSYPSLGDTVFVLVTDGSAWLQLSGRPARMMKTGDFLLLTEPEAWRMGDSEGTPPVKFKLPQNNPSANSIITDTSSTATTVKLLGGRFSFDRTHLGLLKEIIPPIVEIDSAAAGASRVGALLKMLETEAWEARPGSTLVTERLLEILLIEVVRYHGEAQASTNTGLIAGLADPLIAACLRALHTDPSRDWSVAKLAKVAGASRSVFAQRFSEIVGLPPMQYLLKWRMDLAKEMIGQGISISETAFACGYRSVSGFSVAFTRHIGCPPSHLRSSRNA